MAKKKEDRPYGRLHRIGQDFTKNPEKYYGTASSIIEAGKKALGGLENAYNTGSRINNARANYIQSKKKVKVMKNARKNTTIE